MDEPCVFKMDYDTSSSDNALILFSDPILLQKVMKTSKYNMELKPALNLLSSPDQNLDGVCQQICSII